MSCKHTLFVCRTLELSESMYVWKMVGQSLEYSRTPLVWHPCDWTGAELSNGAYIGLGHMVAQLVEALRYKPGGRGFDSRWCHCNFSLI
jgi:hypothetical protein